MGIELLLGVQFWPELVSSTLHLVPQPVPCNLSGIPDTKTSGKDTYSEAEGMPNVGTRSALTPHHQKIRRGNQNASIMTQSLQLAAEEFRKICELKIQKLKGRYSANAILVFNSWLKYMEMCVREWKLTNLEVVQLIKDYTMDNAQGVVKLYLDINSTLGLSRAYKAPQNII